MKYHEHRMSRRSFIGAGALAIAGTSLGLRAADAEPAKPLFSAMGVSGSLDRAAKLKALGADFLTESVGGFLVPDQSDEEFSKQLDRLKKSPLPVWACNGFIRPADLRCVGAEANHDAVLKWSETAFRRLKEAGGRFIVFGSSGARRLKDGWPKEKAESQFVALLKRMGPLAEKHGVIVAVEQLREQECNFINRIGEAALLIRETGHPNVRVLADLYHMAVMGDSPQDLKAAMDVVVHVEIAEKAERTMPGVKGDDFRPYFQVLRESGYHGAVSIEGQGNDPQIGEAFVEIKKQAEEA